MKDRDIEHPDIAAYAETGEPRRRQVTIALDNYTLKKFMTENVAEVLDEVLADGRFMDHFVRDWDDQIQQWCQNIVADA